MKKTFLVLVREFVRVRTEKYGECEKRIQKMETNEKRPHFVRFVFIRLTELLRRQKREICFSIVCSSFKFLCEIFGFCEMKKKR